MSRERIVMIRLTQDLWRPATPIDWNRLSRVKVGEGITVDFRKARNLGFHRKYMALIKYAFDAWEPNSLVQKNFDRFRKDVAIAAGFYEEAVTLKGRVTYEAKSIAFGAMDDTEFEELFDRSIDVLVDQVLVNHTADDVREIIDNIIGFAGDTPEQKEEATT